MAIFYYQSTTVLTNTPSPATKTTDVYFACQDIYLAKAANSSQVQQAYLNAGSISTKVYVLANTYLGQTNVSIPGSGADPPIIPNITTTRLLGSGPTDVITQSTGVPISFSPVAAYGGSSFANSSYPITAAISPPLPTGLTLYISKTRITATARPTVTASGSVFNAVYAIASLGGIAPVVGQYYTVRNQKKISYNGIWKCVAYSSVSNTFTLEYSANPSTASAQAAAWIVNTTTPTTITDVDVSAVTEGNGTVNWYNYVAVSIEGTAASITQQTYTVTFSDGSVLQKTASIQFALGPTAAPPTVNPPVASNVNQTVAYGSSNNTINLSVTNSPTSVAVATQPSHGTVTVSGTTITYTPTVGYSGSDSFTYTATNAGGTSAAATVNITVTALTVTSAVVGTKTFTVGTAITSFNPITIITAGVTPYAYSIDTSSGKPSLPTGLSIDVNTGIISGTPGAATAQATYTVTILDNSSPTRQTASVQFDIVVNANAPVPVVSGSIPILTERVTFTAFSPISVQSGTGTAPYSYSLTGTPLPSGLVYSSVGLLSGATSATSFTNALTPYSVRVSDVYGQTADTSFNLRVNQLTALTAIVDPAYAVNTLTTGVSFSAAPVYPSPSASGYGALTYAIDKPLAGYGLVFNTNTGLISGSPTSTATNTQYSITISDLANQKSTGTFQLKIISPPPSSITLIKNSNSVPLVIGATTNLPTNPISASGGVPPYTYSIGPTSLPAGLTFVSTSGYITGVATTSTPNGQAVQYIVSVTDQYPQTSTSSFFLTVTSPPAINISTAIPNVALVQNTSVTTTYPSGLNPVVATGGYISLRYSISPEVTTFGLSFNTSTGSITGTPSVYRTTSTGYAVTVRDQANQSSTSSFNLIISPPILSVTTNPTYASQRFTNTVPISIFQPVSAIGGALPYVSYSIDNNSLGGLSFNTLTGQVSGVPNQTLSTTSYAITITDSIGNKGTSTFSIYIANADPLILITSSTYVNNTLTVDSSVGLPLSPTVLISNGYGTLTYDFSPKPLPSGLTFANGTISGKPTVPVNTTTYTISLYDSLTTPQTTSTTFSLYIKYPNLVTTLTTNSITLVNTVYTSTQQLISFTGGANGGVTYSISPQIPSYPALQFVSPGIIQGTPGTTSTTSSYALTITDNVTGLTSSKNINIGIVNPPALSYLATGTVTLTVNVATSGVFPVRAVGGYGALTYTLSGATNGSLTIRSATGELTGTPSTLSLATSYSVTIRDAANQVVTGTFNISVISTPIVIVQNSLSVPLIVGAATNLPSNPIGATGGTPPYAYNIGSPLPNGLTFVSTSGYITGVATTGTNGPVVYTVTVSDPYQSNTGSFNLNITYPLPITLTTITNVTLVQGTAVSTTYSSGLIPLNASGTGYQTLTYAINTALPTGLSFNTITGAVTGTPSVYYTTSTAYTVTVRDQASQVNTGTFNLVIRPPVFSVRTDAAYTNQSLTNTVPISNFQPIVATGGAAPYSYQISNTNLGGLSFSTSTGIISGTPSQLLSNSYIVTVTDLLGSTGTSSFNLSIVTAQALTISTVPQYVANSLIVGTATNFTPIIVGSVGYGTLTFSIQPLLPADLTFVNGVISGIPRGVLTTGTFTVTVTDTLPINQTSSTQFTLSVAYTPFTTSLTTSTVKLTKGTQSNVKVIDYAGGGAGGVSYSTIPALPEYPNIQLVTPGVISGIPSSTSTTATYALVVTDNVTGQTSTQYISLNVAEPSSIVLQATGTTVVLYANSATTGIVPVTAIGGIGSLSYAISGGSLPNGSLDISPTTGSLTGTPSTVSSTSSYSVTVTDSQTNKSTATFNLTVLPPPITLSVAVASKGLTQYSQITPLQGFQPIVATNLSYGGLAYNINPLVSSLGLVFNTSTGYISGTPIAASNSTQYYVTVNDQNNQVSTGSFTLSVGSSTPPGLLAIVAQSSYAPAVGDNVDIIPVVGSAGFLTGGSNYSYSILPTFNISGLSFNTGTGQISGTPTATIGPITYDVTVKDSIPQLNTGTFTISIVAAVPPTAGKGYTGSTGTQGVIGFTGSTGTQGVVGFTGSTGTQGLVGYTGSTGTQGLAGSTGTQGVVGFTGSRGAYDAIGFTGSTGTQGEVGFTGSTGTQGVVGFTGSTGTQGVVGFTGSRGAYDAIGFTGSTGTQGVTGYTGSTGTQGEIGFTGSTGTQGVTGYTGSTGTQGEIGFTGSTGTQGVTGFTGSTGTQGVTGFTGSTGTQGVTGYTGSTGTQGVTGFTGSTGTQGVTGYTGSQGDQGDQGLQGTTGTQGPRGYTGEQGVSVTLIGSTSTVGGLPAIGNPGDGWIVIADGDLYFWNTITSTWNNVGQIVGPQGAEGLQGNMGPQGPQGNTGTQGPIGFTGSTGTQGVTGFTGSTGTQGEIGFTGSTGTQGEVGFTGSTGTQGLVGFTGSTGTQGLVGYTGSTGTQGEVGYTGSTGTQGLVGFTGSTGTQGLVGFTGSTGTQGLVGYTGSTGTQGEVGFTGSTGTQGLVGFTGSTGTQGIIGFTGSAGTGSAITVVGNTTLTNNLTTIIFTGTGVISTVSNNEVTVNITGGTETLVWSSSGNYRTLTGYIENNSTKTVRVAEFSSNKLRLTLATFTPILSSSPTPSSSLNWDVPATGFTVTVDNPSDIIDQYVSTVSSITATVGSISALSTFIAGSKSNVPAGTIDWVQTFTYGGSAYIRCISSTISGGTASAQIAFSYYDGSSIVSYATPATWSITWATPNLTNIAGSLTGLTFLQSYSSVSYTISVSGITNASNYSHNVTATGGTISNAAGSGTLTFTIPIHKDNITTTRTTSVTTTFTRPSTITGSSYTAQLLASTSNPSATFTYPSLWIFTSSTSDVPNRATFVTGTGFQTGVTILGNLVGTLAGFITNSLSVPQAFWFAVKATASQPTTFKTGASAGLLSDVSATTGNTVSLQPDSPLSGYIAVTYNLYGITLQNGSTYVSIS